MTVTFKHVKKLKNRPEYRLRVDDYPKYFIDRGKHFILIIAVGA